MTISPFISDERARRFSLSSQNLTSFLEPFFDESMIATCEELYQEMKQAEQMNDLDLAGSIAGELLKIFIQCYPECSRHEIFSFPPIMLRDLIAPLMDLLLMREPAEKISQFLEKTHRHKCEMADQEFGPHHRETTKKAAALIAFEKGDLADRVVALNQFLKLFYSVYTSPEIKQCIESDDWETRYSYRQELCGFLDKKIPSKDVLTILLFCRNLFSIHKECADIMMHLESLRKSRKTLEMEEPLSMFFQCLQEYLPMLPIEKEIKTFSQEKQFLICRRILSMLNDSTRLELLRDIPALLQTQSSFQSLMSSLPSI